MASDEPLDLYIAAYSDPDAAQNDWDGIKRLAKDEVISVDAMVLVERDDDGKIHVRDDAREAGIGAPLGAVFEDRWINEVERALAKAVVQERHHVHATPASGTADA